MDNRLFALLVASLFIVVSIAPASVAVNHDISGNGAIKVRYFFETDTAGKTEWLTFLGSLGLAVTDTLAHDSSTTDLSGDDILILGWDTGGAWADSGDTHAVRWSGKPVIGIGEGGTGFYTAAGMALGSGMSSDGNDDRIYADSSYPAIYTTPNTIPIPPDGNLQVHVSSVLVKLKHIACLPGNVTVLGKDTAVSHAYTSLCAEASQYVLWSFCTNVPSALTDDGKSLFDNVLAYATGAHVPENLGIFPLIGMFLVFLIVLPVSTGFRQKKPGTIDDSTQYK